MPVDMHFSSLVSVFILVPHKIENMIFSLQKSIRFCFFYFFICKLCVGFPNTISVYYYFFSNFYSLHGTLYGIVLGVSRHSYVYLCVVNDYASHPHFSFFHFISFFQHCIFLFAIIVRDKRAEEKKKKKMLQYRYQCKIKFRLWRSSLFCSRFCFSCVSVSLFPHCLSHLDAWIEGARCEHIWYALAQLSLT